MNSQQKKNRIVSRAQKTPSVAASSNSSMAKYSPGDSGAAAAVTRQPATTAPTKSSAVAGRKSSESPSTPTR
ncbi:MAG: hypothetical protein AW07_03806 [Candidatus Accumulibacter sp. SK-11]|nr:MAG: hypothetical protein AW07_03806 [Candidatus Accumulibacter sp. SK-11]